MLLAYIDESYSERALSVACVVIDEAALNRLSGELTDVVTAAGRRFPGVVSTTELHAYHLAAGRGEWSSLRRHLRARAAIFRDALDVTAQHATRILVERASPGPRRGTSSAREMHIAGVRSVLGRLDAEAATHDARCMVLIDEVSYRDDLRAAVEGGMGAHLVNAVHFTQSRVSRPMQAADLCAYLGRRVRPSSDGYGGRLGLDAWLWEAIASKVDLVDRPS